MRLKRWPAIIAVLVLSAVIGTVAAVWLSGDEPEAPSATPPSPSASPSPSAAAPSPSAQVTGEGVVLDFANGLEQARVLGSATGPLVVREESQTGGDVSLVPRDGDFAVRFPGPCASKDDTQCPRAILDAGANKALNPGPRAFRWGAAVLMAPGETSKGSNVLQKGYSQFGTQFKLQVDGAKGIPSCVVAGPQDGRNTIHVAQAEQGVADGRWHTVACARDGAVLRISVDGVPQREAAVPADLSISNDAPLRIGGKGVAPGNDQFHGTLDDLFVAIG
ncbi:LamG-like jellyroll fold domain-containing protein [Catellatospora sichuanensis]|uniref:LamG-like jellyroll fold domain-containing protein n=1 Tax=Catellatospora sichuanensis TaxID=1969805 RepID=UPI001182D120|nr:LamG-like jellyroll fold domain-containing protein [Catellatospora sichuanensis]